MYAWKSLWLVLAHWCSLVQLLHENVRYAITETCLALTIFRDEINFHVVVLFTSLVFLKVFHWLAQSRIEFVRAHLALSSLCGLLNVSYT